MANVKTKFCPDCRTTKDSSEFNRGNNKSGLYTYCRVCAGIRERIFRNVHKDRYSQKGKERYQNNKEESLKTSKEYHYKNKEKINARSRQYASDHKEEIREQRKSTVEQNRERQKNYSRERCKTDPLYKFKKNVRRATSEAFSIGKKSKKTLELLGCSLEEAFAYIESKFTPEMNWDNYGSYWHLDHIVPLASAKTIEEVEKLCHYTNLQPLEARENIIKSDKMDWKPSVV